MKPNVNLKNKTVYLYVKQHNDTMLRYLGKTSGNPYQYKGSGKYWRIHLKKHGNNVSTYIIGSYDTAEELKEAGLHYSKSWNIVASNEWANLTVEEGHGGPIRSGMKTTEETKIKQSAAAKNRPRFTKEHRENLRKSHLGNRLSEETKKKIRKYQSRPETKERQRITHIGQRPSNASKEKNRQSQLRPEVVENNRQKHLGRIWITDSITSKQINPGDQNEWFLKGFRKGRK